MKKRFGKIITLVFLAATACDRAPTPTHQSFSVANDGKYHILALGDSYTSGESVDPAERWPVQLAALLRTRGIDAAEPMIIAQTGWTTQELSAAIDAADPKGPFDLVTLSIGVNNQFRHYDINEYPQQFDTLLDHAISFAGGDASHVVVLSIPDWGVTPFGQGMNPPQTATDIDAYNAINRRETLAKHAVYVDVTGISRHGTTQPDLQAPDGLHPSGAQYAQWAHAALDAMHLPAKSPAK